MKAILKKIIWMDPDRFDLKPNKSPMIEMSRALTQEGFDVVIVTGYGKNPYQIRDSSIAIVSLSSINLSFLFRYSLMMNMLIWTAFNAKRDDIFILNQTTLLLSPVLRLLGFSNLHLDIRTLPLRANKSWKKRIDRFLFWTFPLMMFVRLVRSYSFITNRLRLAIQEEFSITFDDYVIWQSGVNTRVFKPIENNKVRAADNRYTIFYHGSIYGNRGVDNLIDAMSILRPAYKDNVRLVIVGPVLDKIGLEGLINKQGLSGTVFLEGMVPYEEIPERIAQADCCVCPLPDLIEWNVSSPLKVFEYMACGRPIILTPIPAHKDVADGLDYIVWAKGSQAEDLSNAIEYAFDHKDELSQTAIKAYDHVKSEYDWEVQGRKLSEYLLKRQQLDD
ncbi:MAG: glycosyltransferase [Gammaproteobacteria bacterium]|nr:glycosyltransferase [Gammaproteobacteria bacterium]